MRRALGVLVLLGGPVLYARRRRREQVHVHFEDGSTVTLADGAPEAARLLALARHGL
jgi:hypothetical protein